MAHKRIELIGHFSETELKSKYLSCSDAVEKTHWQIIWLLSRTDKSYCCTEVADIVGYSVDWIRKLVRRYNAEGSIGLKDGRQTNGATLCVTQTQQSTLATALSSRPPDGGLWSGPKVARWLRDQYGLSVTPVTGWNYLNRLGLSLQVPRRQHQKAATAEEQTAFKKTSG